VNSKPPSILSLAGKPMSALPGAGVEAMRSKVFVGPKIEAAGDATAARVRQASELAAQGGRLAERGQLARAIDKLQQATRLDPLSADAHEGLGIALAKAERMMPAAQALGRAVALDPNRAQAHDQLALVLEIQGRDLEAEPVLEAAVALDPKNFELLARLARVKASRGKLDDRIPLLRAAGAAARAAGSPKAVVFDIRAEMHADRLDVAETLARAAIEAGEASGEVCTLLGQILAQRGRADEAQPWFEQAVKRDPKQTWAWLGMATNRKFKAGDEAVARRMSAALERKDLTPPQRQPIHFALGKAYDDLGDYASAMRQFDDANAIRGAHKRLDRQGLETLTDAVIGASPPGFLDRRPDLALGAERPIFVLGMPRSGTTLAEQVLSAHPDVAAGGELGFWTSRVNDGLAPFGAGADAAAAAVGEAYLRALQGIDPLAPRVTDKAPFNFVAIGQIRQLFPHAAIVHCRRDPIDVCLSIYTNDFAAGFEFASDRGDLVFYYRQYERLMAHWREVIPAERFFELDYEDLVADPEPATRRLLAACGLSWSEACLSPHLNDRRRITTASIWQARQPIYRTSARRWRRYEPWLGELKDLSADGAPSA
jgi:tetratricopeptide (TPR) repeat protein